MGSGCSVGSTTTDIPTSMPQCNQCDRLESAWRDWLNEGAGAHWPQSKRSEVATLIVAAITGMTAVAAHRRKEAQAALERLEPLVEVDGASGASGDYGPSRTHSKHFVLRIGWSNGSHSWPTYAPTLVERDDETMLDEIERIQILIADDRTSSLPSRLRRACTTQPLTPCSNKVTVRPSGRCVGNETTRRHLDQSPLSTRNRHRPLSARSKITSHSRKQRISPAS